MLYRIENGCLIEAPIPLNVDGRHIFTTDESLYLAQGYKQLIKTLPPKVESGFKAVLDSPSEWTESEDAYTQTWHIEEDDAPEAEPDLLGLLEAIL